jgi:hypothetical protein
MRSKRERAVTAQTCPVLDLSSFAPALKLPRKTFLQFAYRILNVHVSGRVIAVFVFRKPLFINKLYLIYVRYTTITYIAVGFIHSFT